MTKIGFYPGCSLHGTGVEYEESLSAVCKEFGIELVEINDWNCCGATAAHSLNKLLSVSLPARNLVLAEEQGFDEILVPCAACYSRLISSYKELKKDAELNEKVTLILEKKFSCNSKPINIFEFINKYIKPELKEKVKFPFNKSIACYYGCLLVRPPKLVENERYEDPNNMEELMEIIGAKPIKWAFKTECCGAGLSVSRTDIVGKLSGKILDDAVSRNAEVIVTACPMCQSNLDMRRNAINDYLGKKFETPILFITQAIGLAIGIDMKKLGLHRNLVSTRSLLSDYNNKMEQKKTAMEVENV